MRYLPEILIFGASTTIIVIIVWRILTRDKVDPFN